jgi:hypothetical protein
MPHSQSWLMRQAQADEPADAAATALRALAWRARWNLQFEEGILRGANNYNEAKIIDAGQAAARRLFDKRKPSPA